ncbi:hypothetical protein H1R20_g12178, partial [Candolleomyces eurysporus]
MIGAHTNILAKSLSLPDDVIVTDSGPGELLESSITRAVLLTPLHGNFEDSKLLLQSVNIINIRIDVA